MVFIIASTALLLLLFSFFLSKEKTPKPQTDYNKSADNTSSLDKYKAKLLISRWDLSKNTTHGNVFIQFCQKIQPAVKMLRFRPKQ